MMRGTFESGWKNKEANKQIKINSYCLKSYAPKRDDGIIEALNGNAITNCSLLVNGVSAESFANKMKQLKKTNCVGLHLNLTEGRRKK